MIVFADLQASPATVELREPSDLKAFKVVVAGGPDGLAEALAPLGHLVPDGGHAFLRPEAVQALPGAPQDAEWQQGFAGMVAYATGKGWTDDAGAVRAHVEPAA